MALAAVAARRGVVVGGRDQSSMRRDDAAPAPGLGLAGPAPFERRQELAVQLVARAVRGVRVNIRVGNENPVMRRARAETIAEICSQAARRRQTVCGRAAEAREAPHRAERGVFVLSLDTSFSGFVGPFHAIQSSEGWPRRSVDVT